MSLKSTIPDESKGNQKVHWITERGQMTTKRIFKKENNTSKEDGG